jgi:hypothetical protein
MTEEVPAYFARYFTTLARYHGREIPTPEYIQKQFDRMNAENAEWVKWGRKQIRFCNNCNTDGETEARHHWFGVCPRCIPSLDGALFHHSSQSVEFRPHG